MRVCIHRGTKQIGGTCVEIEALGGRIIVDLGLPLDAVVVNPALVPQISGLREHDPSLLAIVLSHGHRDHWGLIPKVRPDIPIVMGRATESIMRAAADFVPDAFMPKAWKYLESGKPLQIGQFVITHISSIIPALMPTLWRLKPADNACSIPATCVLMVEKVNCLN